MRFNHIKPQLEILCISLRLQIHICSANLSCTHASFSACVHKVPVRTFLSSCEKKKKNWNQICLPPEPEYKMSWIQCATGVRRGSCVRVNCKLLCCQGLGQCQPPVSYSPLWPQLRRGGASSGCNLTPLLQFVLLLERWWGDRKHLDWQNTRLAK